MTKTKKDAEVVEDSLFELPKETLFVRYVKRQTGFIRDPKHIAYGGKIEGAFDELPAKQNRMGQYVSVLDKKEEKGLEEIMGVEDKYLSLYRTTNNFWDTIKIRIPKEGIFLDLSKPFDYIKYKILLTYDDYISPSVLVTYLKRSYKYEIVKQSDINKRDASEVNYDIEAYKLFGKIEDSREQLAGILQVLTKKAVSTTDHDWLIREVGKRNAEKTSCISNYLI